jgi:hypothetical protein
VHEVIGGQHVITSPDVPGLYVAHADEATARAHVPDAIKMLEDMAARRARRQKIKAGAA